MVKKEKKSPYKLKKYSDKIQLFVCLFFLKAYPTNDQLNVIFRTHPATLTRWVKRMLAILMDVLCDAIKWLSDDEFQSILSNGNFSNHFQECVCAVDGTEIQISRPSKQGEIQRKTFSVKKKQFSFNVLLIVKFNGEIIYSSRPHMFGNDQSCWNEENLRELFVGKTYGIIGDGGFYFNPQNINSLDLAQILGYTPIRQKSYIKKDEIENNHL